MLNLIEPRLHRFDALSSLPELKRERSALG